jgi:hypothetical protein
MAADFGFGTEQTSGGRSIDVASAANVHIVPSGEKHKVTVFGNSITGGDFVVKIDGESTGITETTEAKKTRVIWTGVVTGDASTSAINVDGPADGRCWVEYQKLS